MWRTSTTVFGELRASFGDARKNQSVLETSKILLGSFSAGDTLAKQRYIWGLQDLNFFLLVLNLGPCT